MESDYEKELWKRFEMMKQRKEIEQRGPRPASAPEKRAYSKRFKNYMDRMRKKRALSLREFEEK